jgi:hypothetical protein
MKVRMRVRPHRARWLQVGASAVILLVAACGGSDPDGGNPTPDAPALTAPAIVSEPAQVPPFLNDPDLERYVTAEALGLPARFEPVSRDDREPILSLGLVDSAARITFSSVSTRELLSFDLLRLEEGVDADTFFTAFADSLRDNNSFQGINAIGVPRGVGERARRYVFSVNGDEAESAALLRDGVVALITHRRPPGLRQALDLGELMESLDRALQGDS